LQVKHLNIDCIQPECMSECGWWFELSLLFTYWSCCGYNLLCMRLLGSPEDKHNIGENYYMGYSW